MKNFKILLLVLLLIITFSSADLFARSIDGRKTVKVSFSKNTSPNRDNLINESFYFEWLQYFSKFIDWDFEVSGVEHSPTERFESLKTGKIDMIPFFSKSTKREKDICFSNEPVGDNTLYLVKSHDANSIINDSHYTYRDQQIGLIKNNVNNKYFFSYAKANNFFEYENDKSLIQLAITNNYIEEAQDLMKNITWFDNQRSIISALEDGTIKLALLNNFDDDKNYELLDTIDGGQLFVALNKDFLEYVPDVDSAIKDLNKYYPTLIKDLKGKYKLVPQKYNFDNFELAYIDYLQKNKLPVNILVPPDVLPLNDDSNGDCIIRLMVNSLKEKTNIDFDITCTSNIEEYNNKFASDDYDFTVIYTNSETDISGKNILKTLPYYYCDVVFVSKKGALNYDRVAIVNNSLLLENDIEKFIVGKQKVYFDSKNEAIEAINQGKVDCIYLTSEEASYWISNDLTNRLVQTPVATEALPLSFGVKKNTNPALFKILNEAIYSMDSNNFNLIVNNYMQQFRITNYSFKSLLYRNPVLAITQISILFLIVTIIIILLFKVNKNLMTKKYNEQLEISLANEKKANNSKNDFISKMSHDMRTPINTILGLAYFGLKENDLAVHKRYFEQIKESGNYVLSLVNDVLNMQKLNWKEIPLNKTNVEVNSFINNINTIVSSRAKEKSIKYTINQNLTDKFEYLYFDRMRASQIIINIINNAIKYTKDNGNVTVNISFKEDLLEKNGKNDELVDKGITESSSNNKIVFLQFDIIDDGIGISEEFLPNLFNPFTQEKSELSNKEGGSGLGLAIVKGLITPMYGTITVESTLGVGSTFHVTIPVGTCEKIINKCDDLVLDDEIFKGKKVLLFEDVVINEKITRKLLNEKGLIVDSAYNGKVGVEKYLNSDDFTYDIILMDVQMPIMDGLEATDAIRNSKKLDSKKIKIIALSANVMKNDIDNTLKNGMNDYIVKPIVPEKLFNTIAKQLRSREDAI